MNSSLTVCLRGTTGCVAISLANLSPQIRRALYPCTLFLFCGRSSFCPVVCPPTMDSVVLVCDQLCSTRQPKLPSGYLAWCVCVRARVCNWVEAPSIDCCRMALL